MDRLRAVVVLVVAASVACSVGCRSFRSQRIVDDTCPFRGAPAAIYRPHRAVVSWARKDNPNLIVATTQHLVMLPTLYAVDPVASPIGNSEGKITLQPDGTLEEAHIKKDHQIDELIKSVGQAVGDIAKGAGQRGAADEFKFTPDLDETATSLGGDVVVVSIDFTLISQ